MDKNRIIELIQNPQLLSSSDNYYIERELLKYPFASSFHMLFLRWGHLFSQGEKNEILEKVSVYSSYRELIREVILQKPKAKVSEIISLDDDREQIKPILSDIRISEKTEIIDLEELQGEEIPEVEEKQIIQNKAQSDKEDTPVEIEDKDNREPEGEKVMNNDTIDSEINTSFIDKLGISHLFVTDKEKRREAEEQKGFEPDLKSEEFVLQHEGKVNINDDNNNSLYKDKEIENVEDIREEDQKSTFSKESITKEFKNQQNKQEGKDVVKEERDALGKEYQEENKNIEPEGDGIITPVEKLKFNDWLLLSSKKVPVTLKKEIPTQEKQKDIIEQFIENNPKITAPKKEMKVKQEINFKKDEIKDIANLMTITLAQLYVEQGKYDTAITAFKILSLKYPEKSSYFASEIKKIKKIKNSK